MHHSSHKLAFQSRTRNTISAPPPPPKVPLLLFSHGFLMNLISPTRARTAVLAGRMGWLRPHRKSPELPNTWRAAKWQGWVWNFPNCLPSRLSPESGGPGKDELTQGLSYTSLWTATSAGAPSKSLTWKTCLRALGPRACLPCTIGAKEWRPKLAQLQPRPQTRTSNMASPLRQTWPEPDLGAVSGAVGQVD